MLLVSKGVTVHRPGSKPLVFPDIEINTQENILLLGPSGSGKTTWLSVMAGLLKPDRGQVLINGQDIYQLSSRTRDLLRGRNFGFIFQALHLLPSLSLKGNIKLAPEMAGIQVDHSYIDLVISSLGLSALADKKPQNLSIGEQQRCAIARAVINKPQIIYADEPTSALDDGNTDKVMQLLINQASYTKASLIVATHDPRIAPYFNTVINLNDQMEAAA